MRRLGVATLAAAALTAAAASAAPAALDPPARPILGEQRILVVLATWGPQPFRREQVEQAMTETDAFYRASSYGKAWLASTVTGWLAVPAPGGGCPYWQVGRSARDAAATAGTDLSGFNAVVFVHPQLDCGWRGLALGREAYLNGEITRKLIAHELGHTFGLNHSNTGFCDDLHCAALEYGDPYDTMGQGTGDFNALAKYQLGWLTPVEPAAGQAVDLDPLETVSKRPRSLVVTTARNQYWLEYRSQEGRSEDGAAYGPPGLLVRAGPNPSQWLEAQVSLLRGMLLVDPARSGRPTLVPGDRFGEPGAFELVVEKPVRSAARILFRWTDPSRPTAPRIGTLTFGSDLDVRWGESSDTGSGLDRYELSVDGGPAVRVRYELGPGEAFLTRPAAGTHTLSIVAVDRAGNRSRAATRRFASSGP